MNQRKTVTVLAISLIVLTGCSSQSASIPMLGKVVGCDSISLGKSSPGIALPCLDGKSAINLAQLRGPLIVNVWGSWCGPCKDEVPILRTFYGKAEGRVKLLGVNVEEAKRADATNFILRNGMTWPNLIDLDGRTRGFFGMGVPVTWFIDSSGTVVYKKIGVLRSEAELRNLTRKYLNITVG